MPKSFRLLACLALACAASAGAVVTPDGITRAGSPAPITLVPPTLDLLGPACEGTNYSNDNYHDSWSKGGPMVGISWVPTSSVTVNELEVFTGELVGLDAVGIWSDDGGSPSRPLAPLGWSAPFLISTPDTWYGDTIAPVVPVTAGTKYWVVFDPIGGEQAGITDDPADVQQTYWSTSVGTVAGGAVWDNGPYSFPDHRWKFRMACEAPCADGDADGVCDSDDNCPSVANPAQADSDADGVGDACETAAGCGPTGGPDADGDGVCDDLDLCPSTLIPELVPERRLGVNRFALVDADEVFDTTPPHGVGPQATFTLQDTHGCSCEQIIEQLGVGEGHEAFGCSLGIMRRWTALTP